MARNIPSDVDSVEAYDPMNCTHTALRQASRQLTQASSIQTLRPIAPRAPTSSSARRMATCAPRDRSRPLLLGHHRRETRKIFRQFVSG